tara:strand:- start:836 stop:2140 length:1305 start_codon:yes stop_codon:yes gene_type:complete
LFNIIRNKNGEKRLIENKKVTKKLKEKNKNIINQAVILCGGMGKRLGKKTKLTPKPLLKIKKKPFLDYLIDHLIRYKITKIVMLCGYKSEQFINKYHKKKINGVCEIKCIKEKKLMGTGGALINAKNELDEIFYLVNGDTFFNGDLLYLNENFDRSKFDVILATKKILNDRYGSLSLKKKRVSKFLNEPSKKKTYINLGTYIVKKKLFNNYKKKFFSFEKNLLPTIAKKKKIQFLKFENNFFIDIGIKKDLKKAINILPNLKYPAVFFDRDGVINLDLGYVHKKKDFYFTKNIFKTIKYFNRKNYLVFISSNQSGIGRGYYLEKQVNKLHTWMNQRLEENFCHVDEIFYAPYFKLKKKYSTKFHFNLRKPNTGMFDLAKKRWPLDLKKLIVVGDKKVDIEFGRNIKAKTIMVDENFDMFKQIVSKIQKKKYIIK